jgi:hypothetical protein
MLAFMVQSSGFRGQEAGFRISDFRFWIYCLDFRVKDFWFYVYGLWFMVQGFRFHGLRLKI